MQNKCFGVVGEGSLENSHAIIEQYRPSPFVAMLMGGVDGDVRRVRAIWDNRGEVGGAVILGGGSNVSNFICN